MHNRIEYQRQWRQLNPDKSRLYCDKWYAKNPDHARAIHRAGYHRRKIKNFAKLYNTTQEIITKLLSQETCQCCLKPTKPKHRNIDHDHITGQIRGMCCHKCNKAIGALGDNIEGVQNALDYLCVASAQLSYA